MKIIKSSVRHSKSVRMFPPHLEIMDVIVRCFCEFADARIEGHQQTPLVQVVIHTTLLCEEANHWLPDLSTQRISLKQK